KNNNNSLNSPFNNSKTATSRNPSAAYHRPLHLSPSRRKSPSKSRENPTKTLQIGSPAETRPHCPYRFLFSSRNPVEIASTTTPSRPACHNHQLQSFIRILGDLD
ncbi:hypothetical protein AABB24_040332, partial [Solanum stoloniferum]